MEAFSRKTVWGNTAITTKYFLSNYYVSITGIGPSLWLKVIEDISGQEFTEVLQK